MRTFYIFTFGILAGLSVASVSNAQTLGTATTNTSFSGASSSVSALRRNNNSNAALNSVTVAERSDDPCQFDASFIDVTNKTAAGTSTFRECSNNASRRNGTSSSLRTSLLPSGAVATEVRICVKNGKLKGIQLGGRYLGCLLGEAITTTAPKCRTVRSSGIEYSLCSSTRPRPVDCTKVLKAVAVERTNCPGSRSNAPSQPDWERVVSCPDGQVATAIRLATASGGGNRTIVSGVGLECRPISG